MYRRTGCGAPFPSFPSRRDAATQILPELRAPAPAGAFAPAGRAALRILCLCALVFGASGAVAQSAQPQFTLGISAVDSVPQTTVVPVQQPPVQVVEHTTVYEESTRGITQYLYVLNFDSPSLSDYRAERLAWGWRISFGFADGDTAYHAGFEVSTATGETVLTLAAPDLVMRYVGWLWDKRIGDPKFRRLD